MQETTKKKVILMGAISPFCDLVREIVDLNIEPIICDYYSDAPAKKMGYTSYDISTTDIDAIVNLAKRENANGIIHHSEGIDRHAKLLLLKSLTDVIGKT